MRICKHCGVEFIGSVSEFANHVRWCDQNPKAKQYKQDNVNRGQELGSTRFGEYKSFKVTCDACSANFEVNEREKLFPTKERYFCSRSCSNSTGGKAKAKKHHPDSRAHYTAVAWRHHEKECVVCGEDKIVAVHHYDHNHENNDPKNLIPMCPTHHQYMHSRYKHEIEDIVRMYVENKWAVSVVGGTRALQALRNGSIPLRSTI